MELFWNLYISIRFHFQRTWRCFYTSNIIQDSSYCFTVNCFSLLETYNSYSIDKIKDQSEQPKGALNKKKIHYLCTMRKYKRRSMWTAIKKFRSWLEEVTPARAGLFNRKRYLYIILGTHKYKRRPMWAAIKRSSWLWIIKMKKATPRRAWLLSKKKMIRAPVSASSK